MEDENKNVGTEKLDLDELQDKLGGISRYQVGIIVLVSLLPLGTAIMSQLAVFYSAEPEHRCAIPPFENEQPSYEDKNITDVFIPPDDSCKRYDYNLTECGIDFESCSSGNGATPLIDCDYGFVYSDEFYEETTISQFDLVCGRSTLDAVANSLYFVGVLVGSALIGPMLDWFGRKMSMLITCILTIATSLLVAFSSSYEMYISMRVLQAMWSIPCFIAFYTYVNEMSTLRWKTLVGAYGHTVSATSHCLIPILAYFLRYWRNLGICTALMCAPYLVIYFFIPKSPRWLLAKKKEDEAKKIVSRYAKSRKQKLRDDDWKLVVETESEKFNNVRMASQLQRYTTLDLFKPPLMRMVSLNICFLWFLISMVFYGLTLNVDTLVGNPYVNSLLNGGVEILGYALFLGATRVVGIRITGSLSYFLSGTCCLTTMLLIQFADGNKAMREASRWIAIAGKLFATLSFGLIYQFTTELYPTVARGTAMSMGSMSARVGSIIMPFTLELQKTIPWLTQTIFGILGLIGGATCLLLPETLNAGLISTIDDAERFYRKNMKLTASILDKRNDVYQNREDISKTIAEYQCDFDKEKVERTAPKI